VHGALFPPCQNAVVKAPKIVALMVAAAIALAGCGTTTTGRAANAPAPTSAPEPSGSTWQITAEPQSSPPAATTAQSPSTATPKPPSFTPVTVDGWRYGVAWTDFTTDTGTADDPTSPGWVNIEFTMQLRFADNRRATEPPPDVFGNSLGWAVFISNQRVAAQTCPDDYTQQPCEVTFGVLYAGCTRVDTSDTQIFGTVLTQTCTAGPYRDGVNARDFKVEYAWTDFDTSKERYVPLTYQG
jgi:hypothetical protein